MNKERLLQLADAIEKNEIVDINEKQKIDFSMRTYYGHPTIYQSTACIAGSACFLFDRENIKKFYKENKKINWILLFSFKTRAQFLLDLNFQEARDLFTPHYPLNWNYDDITKEEAVLTLRNFAETGKVSWQRINGSVAQW